MATGRAHFAGGTLRDDGFGLIWLSANRATFAETNVLLGLALHFGAYDAITTASSAFNHWGDFSNGHRLGLDFIGRLHERRPHWDLNGGRFLFRIRINNFRFSFFGSWRCIV